MGEPGGICVSGTVHDSVRNKLSFDYEAAGEQSFKNIAEPVRAFHLREGARAPNPGRRGGGFSAAPALVGGVAVR